MECCSSFGTDQSAACKRCRSKSSKSGTACRRGGSTDAHVGHAPFLAARRARPRLTRTAVSRGSFDMGPFHRARARQWATLSERSNDAPLLRRPLPEAIATKGRRRGASEPRVANEQYLASRCELTSEESASAQIFVREALRASGNSGEGFGLASYLMAAPKARPRHALRATGIGAKRRADRNSYRSVLYL